MKLENLRKAAIILILLCAVSTVSSQNRLRGFMEKHIDSCFFENRWKANWISTPSHDRGNYGVWCFRKCFKLDTLPGKFVIHVSADNQFKLYVNGSFVAMGPSRGDIQNWHFETVDIARYLKAGANVLAAEVWNYAGQRPQAQVSYGDASLMVQGNSAVESVVNTNTSWLVRRNDGYRQLSKPRGTTAGPGEIVIAGNYPWNWQKEGFDDSKWDKARKMSQAAAKGAVDYMGRLLVPSPLPQMERTPQMFKSVKKTEGGVSAGELFLQGEKPVVIPAGRRVRIVLDQGVLTTGYPVVCVSGGKGACIEMKYVEAYYSGDPKTHEKGNRNDIDGKKMEGHRDKIYTDGGKNRIFETLWWRTWRYVDIDIETSADPLVINSVTSVFSAYPFCRKAHLQTEDSDSWLERILDIGWRTARLCAHDMYMDCPYYEQLQYFGDTRIQAMVTMYNTSDDNLVKLAIEQGRRSITADGLTLSRYPSNGQQVIPTFSIWWIGMMHDYWMMRGDEDFLRRQLPAARMVMSWWNSFIDSSGLVGRIPYWFFMDWAKGFEYGVPERDSKGHSAMQDIVYIMALQQMAEMEERFGMAAMAEHYRAQRRQLGSAFRKAYWNTERNLFADNVRQNIFSQHTNALAILAGLVSGENAREVMLHTLRDADLIQATIYFRYYVNMALAKAGLGDMLTDELAIWRNQMELGLTTWAETPEPSRSDCHAWGSSPNVELFRTLLGISPSAPAFAAVRIAPCMGGVRKVSGRMPHPEGDIAVSYSVKKGGRLTADITLPDGLPGVFVWQGKEYRLKGGKQTLKVE